jgi:hypothetical protein
LPRQDKEKKMSERKIEPQECQGELWTRMRTFLRTKDLSEILRMIPCDFCPGSPPNTIKKGHTDYSFQQEI